MDADTLTTQTTEQAKQEVARDFASWLKSGGMDIALNGMSTRTAKCYVTERQLAYLVARTVSCLGDNVARGALIEFASTLSDYIERDSFEFECVFALNKKSG